MALEINDQFDFFKAVQLDDDGNLLVSIVGDSAYTANYFTTAATLSGSVVSFDRTDLANAYSVDLSGLTTDVSFTAITYLDCDDATPASIEIALDGGSGATVGFEYNADGGFCGGVSSPAKEHPYKVDRTSSSAYTFSGEINVLSISNLTEAASVTLPQYPLRDFYVVKDTTNNADDYPITVSAGNKTINGESNYIINIKGKPSITFLWNGAEYITI